MWQRHSLVQMVLQAIQTSPTGCWMLSYQWTFCPFKAASIQTTNWFSTCTEPSQSCPASVGFGVVDTHSWWSLSSMLGSQCTSVRPHPTSEWKAQGNPMGSTKGGLGHIWEALQFGIVAHPDGSVIEGTHSDWLIWHPQYQFCDWTCESQNFTDVQSSYSKDNVKRSQQVMTGKVV